MSLSDIGCALFGLFVLIITLPLIFVAIGMLAGFVQLGFEVVTG